MTPEPQKRVVEVHPEVCSWALAGRRPAAHYKGSPEGVPVPSFGEASTVAPGAEAADVLDALAAAWTAWRCARGCAGRLPATPPTDLAGLRMEMVY